MNKEESEAKRIILGKVDMPKEALHMMRYVKVEGDKGVVYAQPFVTNRLTEAEKARREKEKENKKISREKLRKARAAENAQLQKERTERMEQRLVIRKEKLKQALKRLENK
ncbi:MAG: hypothetical protein ABIG69_11820 [Bacteroidota bacterium]